MPKKKPLPQTSTCFNCGKLLSEDNYCFGCKSFVCDDCDLRQYSGRVGSHPKEDHLIGDDEEEAED